MPVATDIPTMSINNEEDLKKAYIMKHEQSSEVSVSRLQQSTLFFRDIKIKGTDVQPIPLTWNRPQIKTNGNLTLSSKFTA